MCIRDSVDAAKARRNALAVVVEREAAILAVQLGRDPGTGEGVHVPELGADLDTHVDAVAGVVDGAVRVGHGILGVGLAHLLAALVAAAGKNHAVEGAHVQQLAVVLDLHAQNRLGEGVLDEVLGGRIDPALEVVSFGKGLDVVEADGVPVLLLSVVGGVDRVGDVGAASVDGAVAPDGVLGHADAAVALLNVQMCIRDSVSPDCSPTNRPQAEPPVSCDPRPLNKIAEGMAI